MLNNRAKEVILQAAMEAIAENSISNTSMQVIAKKAGMRQPNLHYYFSTKKELLMQLMTWMQAHYDNLIDTFVNEKETPEGKLSGFFEQEKFSLQHEPAFMRVSLDLWGLGQSDPEIKAHYANDYATWRGRIAEAIAQCFPTVSETQRNLTASMIISMLLGASIQYMCDPEVFDLDHYMQFCLDASIRSLQSAPSETEP